MVVVLISGRGSNMRALIEAGLPVSAVISNRGDAEGLALASARGIATHVVEHRTHATREAFDAALAAEIDRRAPRVVALAGFMRILTPGFVARYRERLLNIHPSLLPEFPGLHTHERALEAGVKVHGCTVHFVTPELDHGPIVAQAAVPVRAGDDAAARQATNVAVADGARYSFEFAQPAFVVSRYVIEHDAAGRAKISFQKKTDGLNEPPVVESFDISPAAAARILAAWGALNFLDSQADYQADKQFPHLGVMKLRLRSGDRQREAEFNWTNDEHAKALVAEYKALAEQQLFVFDMGLARQYQPSEAIKVLKRLETLLKLNSISDPAQLLPLLRDLTTDERIPLIARNHAERLIKQIEK
jgi:phosphoribosylglycinamide formyltransferase-1